MNVIVPHSHKHVRQSIIYVHESYWIQISVELAVINENHIYPPYFLCLFLYCIPSCLCFYIYIPHPPLTSILHISFFSFSSTSYLSFLTFFCNSTVYNIKQWLSQIQPLYMQWIVGFSLLVQIRKLMVVGDWEVRRGKEKGDHKWI